MNSNSSNHSTPPTTNLENASPCNRRSFVKRVAAVGAAAGFPCLASGDGSFGWRYDDWGKFDNPPFCLNPEERRQQAFRIRYAAALQEYERPIPRHVNNGDDERYRNKIASFTKGMPHNDLGEVDLNAYRTYLHALCTGEWDDFERIPLGCSDGYKLVNPQAGMAFDLEGADAHAFYMPPAPAFGSLEEDAEMIELYWIALTRDVPFSEYDTNPLTQAAAADLTRLGDAFKGPKDPVTGQVTTRTLFRDNLPGCLEGPYQSQFRYLPVTFGANYIEQRMQTVLPQASASTRQDFLTEFTEWLKVQNGCFPTATAELDPVLRYIRSARDAGWWVHQDTVDQGAFFAMLILLYPLGTDVEGGLLYAPLNPGNPYLYSRNQVGFGTFGLPHISALMPEAMSRALKAVRFQKFFVHRRLRPEEYGGRIHLALTGAKQYPVDVVRLRQSPVLDMIYDKFGSYLLPQVFPEGCPLHPSYGQGHSTVSGACITMLKAFFDGYVFPNPVEATPDGTALMPYTGPGADQMAVMGELNKLASNVAQSRNMAGVHWRSDGLEGLLLGESVAISILRDQRRTYNEKFKGFTFTKFDGSTITI